MLNNKNSGNWFFANAILLCILPNILGVLYSLYLSIKTKKKEYIIIFLCLFTLFLTYNFYSVDNTLRYIRAYSGLVSDEWITGNPLDYLLAFLMETNIFESSHVIYIYILFIYFFWYQSLKLESHKKFDITFFILLIFTISLRYAIDLLYYTMSVIFTVYFLTKNKMIMNIYSYIILFIGVYLIHPGVFMILLPALCIYFSMRYNNLYRFTLILIFISGIILSNNTFNQTGVVLIDSILGEFNHYTTEGKWATREGASLITGITHVTLFYIIPLFHYYIFYLSYKYHKILENKFTICIFQAACLFYPSFINFITLTERILLTMMILSLLILYQIYNLKKIKKQLVILPTLIIFFFSSWRSYEPILLKNIFRNKTYVEIQQRSYYLPSIILFDYSDYGFSDEFIRRNSKVFSKFYYN